jgi:hypothetical protein
MAMAKQTHDRHGEEEGHDRTCEVIGATAIVKSMV